MYKYAYVKMFTSKNGVEAILNRIVRREAQIVAFYFVPI